MNKMPISTRHWLAGMAAALMLAPAFAAKPAASLPAPGTPEALYQKERAACLDGSSQQERAACLKEAGAALAEARHSRLGNGESARNLRDNALQRCKDVQTVDRDACERMTRGEGTVSGSAASGGVFKELVTIEPAATAPVPVAPR